MPCTRAAVSWLATASGTPEESTAARVHGNKRELAIGPILTAEVAGAQLSFAW